MQKIKRKLVDIVLCLGFLHLNSVSDNKKVDFCETAVEGIYIGSLRAQ